MQNTEAGEKENCICRLIMLALGKRWVLKMQHLKTWMKWWMFMLKLLSILHRGRYLPSSRAKVNQHHHYLPLRVPSFRWVCHIVLSGSVVFVSSLLQLKPVSTRIGEFYFSMSKCMCQSICPCFRFGGVSPLGFTPFASGGDVYYYT